MTYTAKLTKFEEVLKDGYDEYQRFRKDNEQFGHEWHNDWWDFWEWFCDDYMPNQYNSEFVDTLFPERKLND